MTRLTALLLAELFFTIKGGRVLLPIMALQYRRRQPAKFLVPGVAASPGKFCNFDKKLLLVIP